jgi:hypothetical protein
MGQMVTGTVVTNFSFQERVTAGQLAPNGNTISIPVTQTTNSYQTSGVLSGQCNLVYGEQLTFVASTPQTFNLHSGAMLDPFGNALVYARVREFVVQVVTATPGFNVTLYATASNGWPFIPVVANEITVMAGGMFALRDPLSTGSGNGMVVTSSTFGFTINPGSNVVVVNLLVAGIDTA